MGKSVIIIERSGPVAIFRFDKPPVNAIDLELVEQCIAAITGLASDPAVGAIVVTGAGRCFSAGLDLRTVPFYSAEQQRRMVLDINRAITLIYGLSMPVVAAINGHAVAGGFVMALANDYRIGTSAPCKLGLTESKLGIPFPVTTMELVKSELAPAVARRLTLIGELLEPEEALREGILDELAAPELLLPRALQLATELAAVPRAGYAEIKRELRESALARMEAAVTDEDDPMLAGWIGDEGRAATARLIERL